MRSAPAQPLERVTTSARVALAAVVALGCLAACAPPVRTVPGVGAAVFVVSGLEGTVHRLDPATGDALGAPLPVPGRPWQLAPGPAGGALVLSLMPDRGCRLTHLVPPGPAGGRWAAHPLPSRSAPEACTHVLLAADGTRYVVVAMPAAPATPDTAGGGPAPTAACRLHIFDLAGPPAAGPAPREVTPCPPDATLTAVAASDGPDGPLLHVHPEAVRRHTCATRFSPRHHSLPIHPRSDDYSAGVRAAGGMFRLNRNRLSGSYWVFTATSRS